MDHDVVEDVRRRHHEAPVERKSAAPGRASPSGLLVADGHLAGPETHLRGSHQDALLDRCAGLFPEPTLEDGGGAFFEQRARHDDPAIGGVDRRAAPAVDRGDGDHSTGLAVEEDLPARTQLLTDLEGRHAGADAPLVVVNPAAVARD